MDVGVILASSRSIDWSNYQYIKQELANLIGYFNISQSDTRFGFIHYNEQPYLDFTFNDPANSAAGKLKRKIFNIPYSAGLPRTDKALAEASKELFSAKGGARKNVPKLLLIVTDTDAGSQPYSKVLEQLKVMIFFTSIFRSSLTVMHYGNSPLFFTRFLIYYFTLSKPLVKQLKIFVKFDVVF